MLSRIRFWVRDYFGFSQAENKGFWAVVFLLILLPFTALISYFLPSTWSSQLQDQTKTDSLVALIEVKQQASKSNFYDDNDNRFSNRDHHLTPTSFLLTNGKNWAYRLFWPNGL